MQSIRDAVPYYGTNLWILIFAILIASVGLNVNSTPIVIGAMLISPLMGPIIGIGVAVGINDASFLRQSLRNFFFAMGIGLFTSMVYFWLSPLSEAHSELLARTSPTIYDVLIALFGGFAGMIALVSQKKWNVIPGVAIATALMPPLCTAGYGIATGQFHYFIGALYLFCINAVCIALSSWIVTRVLRFPFREFPEESERRRSIAIICGITIITLLPLVYFGYNTAQQSGYVPWAPPPTNNSTQSPWILP